MFIIVIFTIELEASFGDKDEMKEIERTYKDYPIYLHPLMLKTENADNNTEGKLEQAILRQICQ